MQVDGLETRMYRGSLFVCGVGGTIELTFSLHYGSEVKDKVRFGTIGKDGVSNLFASNIV